MRQFAARQAPKFAVSLSSGFVSIVLNRSHREGRDVVVGTDYVTNKNIVSLETGWKNNIRMDAGFFPGSGFQTPGDGSTGAIRGRLEFGNRAGNLRFVARFANGSDEYTKLKAQTTGTAVITLAYDVNNSLQLTWHQVAYSVVEIAETDQILTVAVDCVPMYHSVNGILTAVGKCAVDGICQ
jgi:hypothetical protein